MLTDFLCVEELSMAWQVKDELQNICYQIYLKNGKLILLFSYTLPQIMPRSF